MKTQNLLTQIALVTTMAVFGIGCAKKGHNANLVADDDGRGGGGIVAPLTPGSDSDADRGADFAAGATAELIPDSGALAHYAVTHPLNNPTNVRISVNLTESATSAQNQFYGKVMVSYYDNNQYFTGIFKTENRRNCTNSPECGNNFPGYHHAYYNNWFNWGSEINFHGFYQDPYGALMIIVDDEINQGDGGGASEVSGEIWFKNYYNTTIPNTSAVPCWFKTAGPYDCRTFLRSGDNTNDGQNDGHIASNSALYPTQSQWFTTNNPAAYNPHRPDRGWTRLGRFSGLNKARAFKSVAN